MQRAMLPGESSHSELVSESSTAGSTPLPLQTTVSSTRFAALPLSVQQLTNVASSMLGQAPQIVDSISPALQFSSIGSLVDQLNPPNAKQPRVEVTEQPAEPYDASADVDDDDEEKPVPKKTRGRVRIKMEYIQNKLRRYTTFSKRKSGLMKKVSSRVFAAHTRLVLKVVRRGVLTFLPRSIPAGLRTCDVDRDPSDAPGRLRDWTRVHLRDAQAPANDHIRERKSADPDLFELTRPTI